MLDNHKFHMGVRIGAPLLRDVMHDTVEDVLAGPNAREC